MPTKNKSFGTAYGRPNNLKSKSNSKRRKPKSKSKNKNKGNKSCNKQDIDKLCRAICARVDPNHVSACCTSYDSNSTPILTWSSKARYAITSSAGGEFISVVKPSLAGSYAKATTITASKGAAFGSASAVPGYDATALSKYRIVSIGVRYLASAAPTNSSGLISMATVPRGEEGDYSAISMLASNYASTRQYQADMSCRGVTTGNDYKHFVAIAATAEGWQDCMISGSGLAASEAVGFVEVIVNCELVPTSGDVLMPFARRAGPDIPQVQAIIENVKIAVPTTMPLTVVKYQEQIKESVFDHVVDFANAYGPDVIQGLITML